MMINKSSLKHVLADLPLAAETYWLIFQQGKPLSKSFSLERLKSSIPEWSNQATEALSHSRNPKTGCAGRSILIFSTLRYWIEHAVLLAITLAGLGNEVKLIFLPYANWRKPLHHFDLRRQNAYARKVLERARPLIQPISLLDIKDFSHTKGFATSLPARLEQAINQISLRDVQYTLQIEEFDENYYESESATLFRLRQDRNHFAARAMYAWLKSLTADQIPEVFLTPNGSILEMGAIYQVARYMDIPTITYEFGEQRDRIWFALNKEVMLQETNDLWQARRNTTFSEKQKQKIRTLYSTRQSARLWKNFSRRWQDQPSQGGPRIKKQLSLDSRPVALLPANVIGDSLTLGRQVFSKNMTEWLVYTICSFSNREDVQLVIRVHPGERYTKGPSVAALVHQTLPMIPEHIRLIEADSPINTYDLIEIADLGLVYTTTVGMEMAMSAVPVIVAGKTHYREKGFTLDPNSWKDYDALLERTLKNSEKYRLSQDQIDSAWHYAYCFFFEFPYPFPWHLLYFWDELNTWPIERVLSDEGQAQFGDIFQYLLGEPRNWIRSPKLEMDEQKDYDALLRYPLE